MRYACPVRREGQSPPLFLPLSQPGVLTLIIIHNASKEEVQELGLGLYGDRAGGLWAEPEGRITKGGWRNVKSWPRGKRGT
jgi:hypothetical protein